MGSSIAHVFDGVEHRQDALDVVAEVRFENCVFVLSEDCYQRAKIPRLRIVTDLASLFDDWANRDEDKAC